MCIVLPAMIYYAVANNIYIQISLFCVHVKPLSLNTSLVGTCVMASHMVFGMLPVVHYSLLYFQYFLCIGKTFSYLYGTWHCVA